jgi:hypothetical protein
VDGVWILEVVQFDIGLAQEDPFPARVTVEPERFRFLKRGERQEQDDANGKGNDPQQGSLPCTPGSPIPSNNVDRSIGPQTVWNLPYSRPIFNNNYITVLYMILPAIRKTVYWIIFDAKM